MSSDEGIKIITLRVPTGLHSEVLDTSQKIAATTKNDMSMNKLCIQFIEEGLSRYKENDEPDTSPEGEA